MKSPYSKKLKSCAYFTHSQNCFKKYYYRSTIPLGGTKLCWTLGENVHKISLVTRESLVFSEGIACHLVNTKSYTASLSG